MVICLTFKIGNEMIRIKIENREVFYGDRLFQSMVRCIPPDGNFLLKIKNSRNKIPYSIAELFTLTKSEEEEYNNCKTDEDLAEICLVDIKKKGGKLISIEKNG